MRRAGNKGIILIGYIKEWEYECTNLISQTRLLYTMKMQVTYNICHRYSTFIGDTFFI